MIQGGLRSMQTLNTRTSTNDVHPIQWVPADRCAARVTPLEVQLDYGRQQFDSAELGTLVTRLPYAPPAQWAAGLGLGCFELTPLRLAGRRAPQTLLPRQ